MGDKWSVEVDHGQVVLVCRNDKNRLVSVPNGRPGGTQAYFHMGMTELGTQPLADYLNEAGDVRSWHRA